MTYFWYRKRNTFFTTVALLLILVSSSVRAQTSAPTLSYRHFTTAQGLSHDAVTAIFQDSEGYLWFGTPKGVDRFDGTTFVHFHHDPADSLSLATALVYNRFAETPDGTLWVGSHGGLSAMNRATGRCKRYTNHDKGPNSLLDNRITSLLCDSKGRLWIGTPKGLQMLDPKTNTMRNMLESYRSYSSGELAANDVYIEKIHELPDGNVVFASAYKSLFVCPPGNTTTIRHIAIQCTEAFSVLSPHNASPGTVLVQAYNPMKTEKHKIWSVNLTTGQHTDVVPPLWKGIEAFTLSDGLKDITKNPMYLLFVSPFDSLRQAFCYFWDEHRKEKTGLYIYNDRTKTCNVVLAGSAGTFFVDKKGALWISIVNTYSAKTSVAETIGNSMVGVWRISSSPYHIFTKESGLASTLVNGFCEESDTKLLFAATAIGLHVFHRERGTWEYLQDRRFSPTKQPNIMSILDHPTKARHVLLGMERGIVEYDIDHKQYRDVSSINTTIKTKSNVYNLVYSRLTGELWLSNGVNGLDCFALEARSERWKHIRHIEKNDNQGLALSCIRSLVVDEDSPNRSPGVWIGGTEGIQRWDFARGAITQSFLGLASIRNVTDIKVSAQDTVIALGSSMNFYSGAAEGFVPLSSNQNVNSILQGTFQTDLSGSVWWMTFGGDLYRLPSNREGIQPISTTQVSGFQPPKSITTSDGALWFSNKSGIMTLHPSTAKVHSQPKFPTLASIYHNDSRVAVALPHNDTLTVHYGDSFGVDVSTNAIDNLSIQDFSDIHYSCFLEGFDSDWLPMSTQRNFRYTNLEPGTYRLHYAYSSGVSGTTASAKPLVVIIAPPYWKRWEFRLGIAIVVVGSVVLGLYLLIRDERLKSRISHLRLHTLRLKMNPHFLFNSINTLKNEVEVSPQTAAVYIETFAEMMRTLLEESDKEVVSLSQEMNILDQYLTIEQLRFGFKFHYKIQFDASQVPTVSKEQLFLPIMLIQPMVENALYHGLRSLPSGGGEVSILFTVRPDGKQHSEVMPITFIGECVIEDNGIGRVAAKKRSERRKKRENLSLSTLVINERIEIFERIYKFPYTPPVIEDLHHADGSAAGTRVRIQFPVWHEETAKLLFSNPEHHAPSVQDIGKSKGFSVNPLLQWKKPSRIFNNSN